MQCTLRFAKPLIHVHDAKSSTLYFRVLHPSTDFYRLTMEPIGRSRQLDSHNIVATLTVTYL